MTDTAFPSPWFREKWRYYVGRWTFLAAVMIPAAAIKHRNDPRLWWIVPLAFLIAAATCAALITLSLLVGEWMRRRNITLPAWLTRERGS